MAEIHHLLILADIYRDSLDLEDTTVSTRVFNDSKKLGALRDGADITVGRFNRALQWFSDHWPENVEWPAQIERPVAEAA